MQVDFSDIEIENAHSESLPVQSPFHVVVQSADLKMLEFAFFSKIEVYYQITELRFSKPN